MKYNPRVVIAYWRELSIPEPVQERLVVPDRKYRFDFAWPEANLAVEVEGGVFTRGAHGSISGILRDIEKYNLAAVNGWRVLRVLPQDLCTLAFAETLRKAFLFGLKEKAGHLHNKMPGPTQL